MAEHQAESSSSESDTPAKPLDALSLADSTSFDPWKSSSARASPGPSRKASTDEPEVNADATVIKEFDPLVGEEHNEAQNAWAEEESHPPPPRAPTPPSKVQESDGRPTEPSATPAPIPKSPPSATFTPLASIRRTFSRRNSQSTVTPPPRHASSPIPPAPSIAPSSPSSYSTTTEPPFDFPKFLNQMKLKSAEPVAKYLQSYAESSFFPGSDF